jgi:hypothetical protein
MTGHALAAQLRKDLGSARYRVARAEKILKAVEQRFRSADLDPWEEFPEAVLAEIRKAYGEEPA